MSQHGWIGVDLDGTLAVYDGWKGVEHIGEPVPAMAFRVRKWLADGKDVRIFTARVWPHQLITPDQRPRDLKLTFLGLAAQPNGGRFNEALEAAYHIQQWCLKHFDRALPITCVKDYAMVALYDDRCVQVEENTGRLVGAEEG